MRQFRFVVCFIFAVSCVLFAGTMIHQGNKAKNANVAVVEGSEEELELKTADSPKGQKLTSPVFTIEKEPVCLLGETLDITDYVSAKDKVDGDLTDQIEITSSKADTEKEGLYPVTLEVENSLGDTASYRMFVRVEEEKENQAAVKLTQYSVRLEKGASFRAEDYIDEVLDGYGEAMQEPDLEITDEVNTDNPGLYPVVYRLADSGIDASAVLMVEITE